MLVSIKSIATAMMCFIMVFQSWLMEDLKLSDVEACGLVPAAIYGVCQASSR
jgi:hypothetical protein